jgi:hypothetical protein
MSSELYDELGILLDNSANEIHVYSTNEISTMHQKHNTLTTENGNKLTNDLTPFAGIVTIQLDDIDGSLSLHSYQSAMAILIVEIAFDLDFEQRVTDTPAFIVATAVDIEYTQSDNMRCLVYFKGNALFGFCCIYVCTGNATAIEWNDIIAISMMHISGLFGDNSEIHQYSPVLHGDSGMLRAELKTALESESESEPEWVPNELGLQSPTSTGALGPSERGLQPPASTGALGSSERGLRPPATTELVGPTERGLRPPIMTGVVGPNETGPATTELRCQSDTLAFQNDLDPEFSITMIFRWSTTIHQSTVISATVEVNTATGTDQLYTAILYDKLIAWTPISDVPIDSSLHTHTVSFFLLRVFVDKAITIGSDDRGTNFGDISLGVSKLLADIFRCQFAKQGFIQAELLHTEFSKLHMFVHRVGDDNSDTFSANYADIQTIQQQDMAYLHIQFEVRSDTALEFTVGSEIAFVDTTEPETLATSFSADIYMPASSRDGDMTCHSLRSRCESTVESEIASVDTAEPETDPAFYRDYILTIYCTIGSQFSKRGPKAGPIIFGSQLYRTTMIDLFLRCFATLQETTIDWIGGGTHTPDTNPDQSADLRMHITGILYHSRAASLGMLSSIGGCVSRTTTTTVALATTTTSTHTALTTTTTRRQQLLAEFMSGG